MSKCNCSQRVLFPVLMLIGFFVAVVTMGLVCYFVIGMDSTPYEPWKHYRLPKHIIPEEYDLYVFPDIYSREANSFLAYETINVNVVSSTFYIILHAEYLNITSFKVRQLSNPQDELPVSTSFFYSFALTRVFVIEMTDFLPDGSKLQLEFNFTGTVFSINTKQPEPGFYKRRLYHPSKLIYFASTMFAPISARTVFPCFDEPHLKAYFTVHIIHRDTHFALSNMPKTNTTRLSKVFTIPSSYSITHFHKSNVLMSTYLVAFSVLESYSSSRHGVIKPIRIFAPSKDLEFTYYAGEKALKARYALEMMFQFPCPLSKLDMIAIPGFLAMGLENWGLITYKPTALLTNRSGSEPNSYTVCVTVAHELVHSYFGNIVTMEWWDDLWLSEGFAKYLADVIAEPICPHVNRKVSALISFRMKIFQIDASRSTTSALNSNITDRITRQMYSSFFYDKGRALISWIHDLLGNDRFIDGLRSYLKEYKYSSATTSDLWKHLGRNFPNITDMDTFVYQSGLPYISVVYHDTNQSLSLKQDRFLCDSNSKSSKKNSTPSPYSYKWSILITYRSSETLTSDNDNLRMTKDVERIDWKLPRGIDLSENGKSWIVFNADTSGYYRVKYDDLLLSKLIRNSRNLTNMQRAVIVDDIFNLVICGKSSATQLFKVVDMLAVESDDLPMVIFNRYAILVYTKLRDEVWNRYVKVKLSGTFSMWNKTSSNKIDMDNKMKVFIKASCTYRIPGCLREMNRQFHNLLQEKVTTMPASSIGQLACKYGLLESSDDQIETILNLLKTKMRSECFELAIQNNPSFLQIDKYVEILLANYSRVFRTFFNECAASDLCINWLWYHFNKICSDPTKSSDCKKLVVSYIESVSKLFNTAEKLLELEEFLDGLAFKLENQLAESIFKKIKKNIAWMNSTKSILLE